MTQHSLSITHLVEQHVSDAAWLWQLRQAAVGAPHFNLVQLVRLDSRLDADLVGIVEAGAEGWDLAVKGMKAGGAGGSFCLAVLAFASNVASRLDQVMAAGLALPGGAQAIASALAWLPLSRVKERIQTLLRSSEPELLWIGLAAATGHRWNPGDFLERLLAHPDGRVRALAFRSVAELGCMQLLPQAHLGLSDSEASCRLEAARTVSLLRANATSLRELESFLKLPEGPALLAAEVLLRRLPLDHSRAILAKLSSDAATRRLATLGCACAGDVRHVPWLIETMRDQEHAQVAGQAFTQITGIDLAQAKLESPPPHGLVSGPTDDPKDPNVTPDPNATLPWPAHREVEAFWNCWRQQFHENTRYLLGQPIDQPRCWMTLRQGQQTHRAAAALELAFLYPNHPIFEVRSPGFRQHRLLNPR